MGLSSLELGKSYSQGDGLILTLVHSTIPTYDSPTEPRTTEPRMGLLSEWTQPRMGLNPEWD
jgi:hypothetical protein